MCQHNVKIGDNYGMSCAECGQVLEGYGCWAEGSATCNHIWGYCPENEKYEQCIYCEFTRLKEDVN